VGGVEERVWRFSFSFSVNDSLGAATAYPSLSVIFSKSLYPGVLAPVFCDWR
jgi:hypothetical protein